jgi:HK97 family phage prohead protease
MTKRLLTSSLEIRSSSDAITLEGYASTSNQPYDMGWYTETVARGAFTNTLRTRPDVRLLTNHEGLPLARTKSGTLQLSEDSTGLLTRATLDPSDPDVQALMPKLQRGDLDAMSFAFGIIGETWSNDYSERQLNELTLDGGDVSIVTYPANPTTSIKVRSLIASDTELIRSAYRDAGPDEREALASLMLADDDALMTVRSLTDRLHARSGSEPGADRLSLATRVRIALALAGR